MTARSDALLFPAAGLLAEPPGASRAFPVGPVGVDAGEDLPLAAPVTGELHMARTNRGLLVRADVTTRLAGRCSRCLRDIEIRLQLRIDEEVLPSVDIASGLPIDATAEPDVVRLTDHHELDLEPLVREAIQLAEPIAPLCRPDCPGLCPVCGEELALGSHDHGGEAVDPRLEALRAFRVDGDAQTD